MKKTLIILLISFLLNGWIVAQQGSQIKRSEVIENINGTKCYLHFIKPGETLYEIAKAYNVDPEEIFVNNPESKKEIKAGKILKIPYKELKKINDTENVTNTDFALYTVKSKETLYGISKKFGIEIQQIRSLNPGLSESLIEGQIIKLPSTEKSVIGTEPSTEDKSLTHTVLAGETLYSIAKKYNVKIKEIEKINPENGGQIRVGQKLNIPATSDNEIKQNNTVGTSAKQLKKHTVVAGETIFSIAKANSVETDSILKYNPGLTQNISVGQVILIPVSGEVSFIWHKAEKNDKLQNIADKYNVAYDEIIAMNQGIQKKIEKGQLIKIPVNKNTTVIEKEDLDESMGNETGDRKCNNIEKNKLLEYKVALMLPLYLEQADSLVIDSLTDVSEMAKLPSLKFIQFYEGFKMALDSMNKEGMNLTLHVYDLDNSSAKINAVLNSPGLEKMDLIIGPFYSESFSKIAEYAKTNRIRIVNPLSVREEILIGNPFVFKIKPSVSSQSDRISSFIMQHYSRYNIIIIRQNRYKYQEEVSFIKNFLNGHRPTGIYYKNKSIIENLKLRELDKVFSENNLFSIERLSSKINDSTYFSNMVREVVFADDSNFRLKPNFSAIRHNLVIAFSDDKVFSQELMSQLNKIAENYEISLLGCHEWEKFEDLEPEYLENLNVHWLTSTLVSYDDPLTRKWITDFRNIYKTEPAIDKYAFDGFDIGWYFLNALCRFGNEFDDCLKDYHIRMLQTTFDFEQLKGNGFENTYWNVGMHYDYRFIRAGK